MSSTGNGAGARHNKPATMKEVASAAGVGLGTVSRVFSNEGKVAPATREKIERVARELNFRPSALGRGLKRQKTNNIGLIVTDISNNFYGEFAQGVLASAKETGRHVILCASGEDVETEREYIDLLVEQRVDGIIAFPTGQNLDAWQSAKDLGINIVFADRTIDDFTVPSVVVDNLAASTALTEYLLALGHTRIGYLGGPRELTSGRLREDGFRRAHAEAGVEVIESLLVRTRFTRDTAYASALRLLDVGEPPTALVASNNVLGEAALGAIRDKGMRVPEDISVVMFDDVPWANLVQPAMTVVSQPSWRMGQAATRLVLASNYESASSLTIPTELIIRRSAKSWHSAPTS